MREEKFTCDKCGLLIHPSDGKFDNQQIVGGASLSMLTYSGQWGHNQVPPEGWHFHYLCFCEIVQAIRKALVQ